VVDAARIVFARDGWNAPVSAVAHQAGVGMGSLYRRYGSKTELLQRLCVLSMEQSIAAALRALKLHDPWEGISLYIAECVGFGAGAFAPLAGSIEVTDEMITTGKRSHRLLIKLVRRAQTEGSLRPDIDASDVTALIQRFSRPQHSLSSVTRNGSSDRILSIALDGLRAASSHRPLPKQTDIHRHASMWSNPAPSDG
jgi:AcrR family transcriptional regulator